MLVLAYLNNNDNVNACQYIEEIKDNPLVDSIELERFCNQLTNCKTKRITKQLTRITINVLK